MKTRWMFWVLVIAPLACGDATTEPSDPTDTPIITETRLDGTSSDAEEPPPIGYATPDYCGSCHVNHYEQ